MDSVTIIDEPVRVVALDGRVFSTLPKTTRALDGCDYYLKGPSLDVIVGESLGYRLANLVGLPVPRCAICRHPETDDVYFASHGAQYRSGLNMLEFSRVENPELVADCFAFDVWTANIDRNEGNFVSEPTQREGFVRLLAIDFESAQVLRGVDRFTVTAIEPKRLRPVGVVGARCFTAPFPAPMCHAISRVTRPQIDTIMDEVGSAVAPAAIAWRDSATDYLLWRAARIRQLAEEVWNA